MNQLAKTAVKGYLLKNPFTWIVIAIGLMLAALVGTVGIFLMSISNNQTDNNTSYGPGIGGAANISPAVSRWEPLVRKYAAENGIEQYTAVILALIQQESGGTHLDVMQSSESIGLPPGAITDPEFSIKIGVKYFAGVVTAAEGEIKLALQSYNFGGGFIPYALEQGGYSKEVAAAFSYMMATKLGWSSYGDIDYVDHVMRYITAGAGEANAQGFLRPVTGGEVTSGFGARFDPFTGVASLHAGVDFSCTSGQPIFSTKDGKIERAGWENPQNYKQGYGQRIYVSSGADLTNIYGHLSQILVKPGQEVKQGEIIGKCGSTGSSTGNHLHFELVLNGVKVDPLPYVQ